MNSPLPLVYNEVIETSGVKVPFVPEIITPQIEQPMRNNLYEGGECRALRELLREGDRVLELGSGVGLLSTVAATSPGVEKVVTVEANPDLIPLIRETHRLNDAGHVTVLNGVAARDHTNSMNFYLRADFWASSMEPESRPYTRVENLPAYAIGDLLLEYNPTVIVCDIEGSELGLFDEVDLSNVRVVIMQFHPKVYGNVNVNNLYKLLSQKGLLRVQIDKSSTVQCFVRSEEASWPPKDPRFLVSTCMKDEGPFILEWLAWHRSIGIQDFIVFTNNCSDGTDILLDRLEDLGYLRHLPNPALASGRTHFQPDAINYTTHLKEWKQADFYISMDVDEFINIRVGSGKLIDLLQATGPFDALSMAELNHGSNNIKTFENQLVMEQFKRHQSEHPGPQKAKRGVKTIVRLSEKLEKPRNHRPDFKDDCGKVNWIDGSGRLLETLLQDPSLNGIDVRGAYDMVVLDHFALRSLESFILKQFRGDVVVEGKSVSNRYWRQRNKNDHFTSTFDQNSEGFRRELDRLHSDAELLRLHSEACAFHKETAANLLKQPKFIEQRNWIFENSWD